MDMRLELVPLPTSDVDRSKEFYVDRLGFNLDHDVEPGNGMRVVQLTPPGSACSIVVGTGMSDPDGPRVLNLHLVVDDVVAVRGPSPPGRLRPVRHRVGQLGTGERWCLHLHAHG